MTKLEKSRAAIGTDSTFNQQILRKVREARGRMYGKPNSKGAKAEKRRVRGEEFLKDLPRWQFERALAHIFDGNATLEEADYVSRHADRFGRKVDGVTIVDFKRNR